MDARARFVGNAAIDTSQVADAEATRPSSRPSGTMRAIEGGQLDAALLSSTMQVAMSEGRFAHLRGAFVHASRLFDTTTVTDVLANREELDASVIAGGREQREGVPSDYHELTALLASGRSLVARALDRTVPRLAEIADEASARVGGIAEVDGLVVPPGISPFGWRVVGEDLVVVQAQGTSSWTLRASAEHGSALEPALVELSAGDVLYVPRGAWHTVRAKTLAWWVSISVS